MYLFRLPMREERNLFFATVIFLWLLLLAPCIYAWLNTPPNHYCTLLIGYPDTEVCDQNFYIAWGPAQAANNHLLFEDKLNGHTMQRMVFNSWWLFTGKICGILNMDTYVFNQMQRFLVIPILCLVLFNFTGLFFSEKKFRFMAFWLMLFSGYNLSAYPEANMFESMLWEVILPAAHVFFLMAVYFNYQVVIKNGSVLKAGIASFIMSTVYPYATVSICFLMLAAFVFLVYAEKIYWQSAIKKYGVIFLFTIPMVVYDYYIVSTDSRYIDGISQFVSRPVWSFFPAYGLLLLLALYGIWLVIKKRTEVYYFPILWLLCILIQIYFPVSIIPFQIQLVLGIQVPLSILAIVALKEITQQHNFMRRYTNTAFALFFLSVSATNGYMYYRILKSIDQQVMPIYLENEITESIHWLKQNAKEEDVVISTPIISSYIPVLSNCRIYSSDYFAPTPDFEKKEKEITKVFSNAFENEKQLEVFFKQNHIRYVFHNNYKNRRNEKLDTALFTNNTCLQKVFSNSHSQIFRVCP